MCSRWNLKPSTWKEFMTPEKEEEQQVLYYTRLAEQRVKALFDSAAGIGERAAARAYHNFYTKETTLLEKDPITESDPNGLDLKTPGSKADAGKSPVLRGCLQYFPRALRLVSDVSLRGAQKYAWRGWEQVANGPERYGDALGRHLLDEAIDGPIDKDTGLLHAAQVAWNALARLELILRAQSAKEKNDN